MIRADHYTNKHCRKSSVLVYSCSTCWARAHSDGDRWFTSGICLLTQELTARQTDCKRNSATANTSVKFNLFSTTAINCRLTCKWSSAEPPNDSTLWLQWRLSSCRVGVSRLKRGLKGCGGEPGKRRVYRLSLLLAWPGLWRSAFSQEACWTCSPSLNTIILDIWSDTSLTVWSKWDFWLKTKLKVLHGRPVGMTSDRKQAESISCAYICIRGCFRVPPATESQ